MTQLKKEPLFYFLLLGAALFGLFQLSADQAGAETDDIIITQGRIQSLVQGFEKVKQRSPSQVELDKLVQSFVREEVLYREALAMGLDKNDPIIRRRMTQKIAFLSEDIISMAQPDDEVLERFLHDNAQRFQISARYSFQHVYLDAGKRETTLEADVQRLLEALQEQSLKADSAGDSLMVKRRFNNASESEVVRVLGDRFTEALGALDEGSWQGPVVSGFGVHLVYLSERIDARNAQLAEVRRDVLREWQAQQREQANEEFYKVLRARYRVTMPAKADLVGTAQ